MPRAGCACVLHRRPLASLSRDRISPESCVWHYPNASEEVPIEQVSILVGHWSVITEKHYDPWAGSRQEQLEADVREAWASDPLIIGGTKQGQIQ